jgi:hypothetical protein
MGVQHKLIREMEKNTFKGGYSTERGDEEELIIRADGTKGIRYYRGTNCFTIKYDSALKGAGNLADQLWEFFITRLDNLNEPFYFYNPTEYFPPDPTGTETIGRYYVRLKDPNQALSREYFRNCLFRYGLELIECKEFVPYSGDNDEDSSSYIFEIPIEIIDVGLSAYVADRGHIFRKTLFYYDRSDYDNVIDIPFELVVSNPSNSNVNVFIVGEWADAMYSLCTLITVDPWAEYKWCRSISWHFTPLETISGKVKYGIMIDTTDVLFTIHNARLIVRQRRPTIVTVQYPLIGSRFNSTGWIGTLPLITPVSNIARREVWHQPDPLTCNLFKYVPSRYSGFSVLMRLEMNVQHMWALYPAPDPKSEIRGALFDTSFEGDMELETPTNMIFPSKATHTRYYGWTVGDENADCDSSIGWFDPQACLTENGVYEFRVWAIPGIFVAKLYSARLYIRLTGLETGDTFETYWRLAKTSVATGTTNNRTRLNFKAVKHQVCGYTKVVPETGNMYLIDEGLRSAGSVPVGSIIEKSRMTFNNVPDQVKVIRRSDSFSIKTPKFVVVGQSDDNEVVVDQTAVVTLTRK